MNSGKRLGKTALAVSAPAFILLLGCCCTIGEGLPSTGTNAATDRASMAHGADISWLTQLEAGGISWVDGSGRVTDALALLTGMGIDAVRLRVMVDPSRANYVTVDGTGNVTSLLGYCDQAGVVALAKRCRDAGIAKFLINFHFSDTWADPGHQAVPAAWAGHSLTQLASDLSSHVTSVLAALRAEGITPNWVQLGNEETGGILWGSAASGYVSGSSGWSNLASLLNAGYAAVKAVDPSIQVVLHLDKGGRNSLYRWWFDNYLAAGGKWDIIGLSFYPYWQPSDTVAMLQSNMSDMVSRYGKPVMVVEIGGPYNDPSGTKALLAAVKTAVVSVAEGKGLGLFYWEPESTPTVTRGYKLGAASVFGTNQLQFTEALSGLGYH